MKRTRRVEITVQERRVVRFRSDRGRCLGCPRCGGDAVMLAPDEAAAIAGVAVRAVFRWIEAGLVHFREAGSASVVCLDSLPALPRNFEP